VKTHDLAQQLLEGPDVHAVVPTYDENDAEQYVEVRNAEALIESGRWYDIDSSPRDDPAVAIATSDD
jgi:hypothetical protein